MANKIMLYVFGLLCIGMLVSGSIIFRDESITGTFAYNITNVSNLKADSVTTSALVCTDCISSTQITDIYLMNTGDTLAGLLTIDQNSNAISLDIDSEATSADVIQLSIPGSYTGDAFDFNVNGLTTGNALKIYGNALTTGHLLDLQGNAAGGSSYLQRIYNTGTGQALLINQIGTLASYGGALKIALDSGNATGIQVLMNKALMQDYHGGIYITHGDGGSFNDTGGSLRGAIVIQENSGTGSSVDGIQYYNSRGNAAKGINIEMLSSSNTGNGIEIENDGTGKGIFIDQDGNSPALYIDSEATTDPAISITASSGGCASGDNGLYTNSTGHPFWCLNGVAKKITIA